jgi:hypothetical protein
MSAREEDGDVSDANFDAAFAVSIIPTLRRVVTFISLAQTRLHVTLTCGVWALLSDVGFIRCYDQRCQGKVHIGTNLVLVQQTARQVLLQNFSVHYFLPLPPPPPKKNQPSNKHNPVFVCEGLETCSHTEDLKHKYH